MSPINDPAVVAEVAALHAEYEAALVNNDIRKLTGFFWDSPMAIRFGVHENLYGADEIEAFRKARSPAGLDRDSFNVRVVTFGEDSAIVTQEFRRKQAGSPHGRQSQVWRKFAGGWKIVSAHVSLMYDAYVDHASNLAGLPIPAGRRDAVAQNIERARQIAAPLLGFELTEQTESATRFEPLGRPCWWTTSVRLFAKSGRGRSPPVKSPRPRSRQFARTILFSTVLPACWAPRLRTPTLWTAALSEVRIRVPWQACRLQ